MIMQVRYNYISIIIQTYSRMRVEWICSLSCGTKHRSSLLPNDPRDKKTMTDTKMWTLLFHAADSFTSLLGSKGRKKERHGDNNKQQPKPESRTNH
mmetsp:Transcript_62899/g.153132  ORF Transcript_62899/g.153132 Transcript_62899/m.153132 type:complete len:96 (+) Transcript_62899:61-348(+)